MCGRVLQLAMQRKAEHEARLVLDEEVRQRLVVDRYNIGPMQDLFTVIHAGDRWGGVFRRWGLKSSTGKLNPNSKCETMKEKPGYFSSFKRALVPVSGFYEWPTLNGRKRAYVIRPVDHTDHWWFAGLLKMQEGVEVVTIMTVAPTPFMSEIHDRWPLALRAEDLGRWLDPATTKEDLYSLMVAQPDAWADAYEVGAAVGNVRNQGPDLVEPIRPGANRV